jgi:hypothetical protein
MTDKTLVLTPCSLSFRGFLDPNYKPANQLMLWACHKKFSFELAQRMRNRRGRDPIYLPAKAEPFFLPSSVALGSCVLHCSHYTGERGMWSAVPWTWLIHQCSELETAGVAGLITASRGSEPDSDQYQAWYSNPSVYELYQPLQNCS